MNKIGFVQLNSCSGCFFAVLGSIVFPDMLTTSDVRLFRLISEVQAPDHLDVVFVEGCVTDDNQIDLLRRLYTGGAKLIALGTCAVYGGVMSQSHNIRADPVNKYVDVSAMLPGCPPPQRILGNLLLASIEGADFHLSEKNVCAECLYVNDQDYSTEIRLLQPIRPTKRCFLREGVLCLGPVTRAGCEARCIQGGAPCDGCFGSLNRDMPSAISNFFSVLKVSPEIRQNAALAFRYQKSELSPSP